MGTWLWLDERVQRALFRGCCCDAANAEYASGGSSQPAASSSKASCLFSFSFRGSHPRTASSQSEGGKAISGLIVCEALRGSRGLAVKVWARVSSAMAADPDWSLAT